MASGGSALGGPILGSIKERRESIAANTPGVFVVADDPTARARPHPFYALDSLQEVSVNSGAVEQLALRYRFPGKANTFPLPCSACHTGSTK
jgi:hypothetical protein